MEKLVSEGWSLDSFSAEMGQRFEGRLSFYEALNFFDLYLVQFFQEYFLSKVSNQ